MPSTIEWTDETMEPGDGLFTSVPGLRSLLHVCTLPSLESNGCARI